LLIFGREAVKLYYFAARGGEGGLNAPELRCLPISSPFYVLIPRSRCNQPSNRSNGVYRTVIIVRIVLEPRGIARTHDPSKLSFIGVSSIFLGARRSLSPFNSLLWAFLS